MKSTLLFIFGIFISFSLTCQTTISSGIVSGTWTKAGSPYLIEGEIAIENGDSLRIEPGVKIEFQGSYKFKIQGQIIASGNESDSIVFTALSPSIGWQSIRFIETPISNDTSRFEYCVFEYGQVYDLWPENSGGAINCYDGANPLIENNLFTWNTAHLYGGAINCYIKSDPQIIHNTFRFNISYLVGGAITLLDSCSPLIDHNLIDNNYASDDGGAMEMIWVCSPKIYNNTIADNGAGLHGGGIDISGSSSPKFLNTILWGNTSPEGNQV